MKIIKISASLVMVLLIVIAAILGPYYFNQVDIPDLGSPTVTDSEIYDTDYLEPIRAAQQGLVEQRRALSAPSLSLAVAVKGKLIWAEAQGYADIRLLTPVEIKTKYAIGSVSKPVTAALTLKLWESGRLDLDRDIHSYLPDFPAKRYPFSLRQLLSHQAGIRHYQFEFDPPFFSETQLNRSFATISDSLALFADDPLLFEPDTGFEYSTFGYTLISAVIESGTGEGFLGLLDSEVFAPLQMGNTRPDYADNPPVGRATGYLSYFSSTSVFEPPPTDPSYKWAGGGLLSTPTDLVMFGSALLQNDFLTPPTSEEMFTPRKLENGELNPQHYGLGWRIGGLSIDSEKQEEGEIIPLINHGGSSMGAACILFLVPDYDLVVAMSANSISRGGSGPLTTEAAKITREFIYFLRDMPKGVTHDASLP